MNLEQRTLDRIATEFPATEHEAVAALLGRYTGNESGRVRWDILQLSGGKLDEVRNLVAAALTDYRDVLYWAEYQATDPMFRNQDSKKLVDEFLAKWGRKE